MLILYTITYATVLIYFASADYWQERDEFIKKEESEMLGSTIILTPIEEKANDVLMTYKWQEYDAGFANPSKFNPKRHFFEARNDIEASDVFRIIQKMPKGAALHVHDFSVVSQEYFMNLTYRENVYACQLNDKLQLKFLREKNQDNLCSWTLLSELRDKDPDYDKYIQSQFFLNVENPHIAYPDINAVWKKMTSIFQRSMDFLAYKEVFQEHFYQTLREWYNDNVKYCEFRSTFPKVHDLNGTIYDAVQIAGMYQDTLKQFQKDHPDFIGARLIYTMLHYTDALVNDQIENVIKLNTVYPNFLAGFYVSGQEDLGKPLTHFVDYIKKVPTNIKRFFHSGATNWFGATDLNLVDAILLNATRIGHGFGIAKHPLVMETIKQRNIAIEICPISNQVLKLVEDLRNHPAVFLMAQGFPVVISSDDNMLWGTKGLSYDFYMAFMGMTSRNTGLKFLKQLALNSLIHSAMPVLEKKRAISMWEKNWDAFVHTLSYETDKLLT